MQLTPQERDRLLLFSAAELARSRRSRGVLLNVPEAIAIVADTAAEAARDGGRLADAIAAGRAVLRPADLLPGVTAVVTDVRVEALFDDGTRLIVVPDPFDCQAVQTDGGHVVTAVEPGAIILDDEDEVFPDAADTVTVTVTNTATVPISVTSHFHFFECNPRLSFDRRASYGRHLAIPAGASVRFDPGAVIDVALTPIGGERVVIGFSGLVDGPLDAPGARDEALTRAAATGFLGAVAP